MNTDYVTSLLSARSKFALYVSIPVCAVGFISELCSIIVFLSLKTFRQNSCAFYLMSMALFNLIRFILSSPFLAISMAFPINFLSVSFFYCQLRNFVVAACNFSALSCLCLAIIDQYFATSSRPRWQQWSNPRIAHRAVIIAALIWAGHAVPFFLYFNQLSPVNAALCISSNAVLYEYNVYVYYLTYGNLFPLIAAIFGLLAFRNARSLTTRPNPLVRRELDKQLTTMVLVEICVYVCTYMPFSIIYTISSFNTNNNPVFLAQLKLANAITLTLTFLSYGNSFYTYSCVSRRFRHQAKYVFYDMHMNRHRQNQIKPSHIETIRITEE
ncbi:unnamed protein product [Adineta ricciae]|uniref:G-protein coupled receptors family 1 profile domain-containing protein n=1 Tax=Adineta ricciae TaxID=249248 RepID=A0A815L257_ADIRI|nr:unnamed protein product [Adineta ricciae]